MKKQTNLEKQKLEEVKKFHAMVMAKKLGSSMGTWAAEGFKKVTQKAYQRRLDICRKCEFWEENVRLGYGKCQKCGCGKGKHWLPHEQCPIGKWGREDLA